MTEEFLAVLKLVRTDFKGLNSFFTDTFNSVEEVIHIINKHKLSTYVYSLCKDELPDEFTERLAAKFRDSLQQFEKTQELVLKLVNLAGAVGLNFTVIKGIGLNYCIYGTDKIRTFGDLDILVRPEDTMEFNHFFNSIGFFQKLGPTSSASSSNRYARAFLAAHVKNIGKKYSALPFPVKAQRDKPEYIPYCKQDEPNIEMHDGLYFLSASAVKKMMEGTVCISNEVGSYTTLNTEYTFILLLTNTFENSESFFSNTYDFGAALRDYVDLRFFLEKYKRLLDWDKVERIIDEFGIHNIAEIVIGNLWKIYNRDVTFGCLPSIKPAESEWGINILERMFDADLCRKTTLTIMRKRWFQQGASLPLTVAEAKKQINFDSFYKCISHEDTFFNIEYTKDSFVLSWAIPPILQEKSEFLIYQFRFFPLTDSIDYTSYKMDFKLNNRIYKAYGHSTKRHRLGAISKEVGEPFPVSCFSYERMLIIQTSLPFKELGITDIPDKKSLCISTEIFKKHYGNIYHKINAEHSEPVMSLIEIK